MRGTCRYNAARLSVAVSGGVYDKRLDRRRNVVGNLKVVRQMKCDGKQNFNIREEFFICARDPNGASRAAVLKVTHRVTL
jgi:hypothetical protein